MTKILLFTTCQDVVISANLSYECIQNDSGNTGFADVTLTVSGGQAPYTITGYYSGTIPTEGGSVTFEAEHDEVLIFTIEDANGCTSVGNFIEIDCPLPVEDCPCVTNECVSTETFEFTTTIVYDSNSPWFEFYSFLNSPSGYLGDLRGSYKINNISLQNFYYENIVGAVDKYYNTLNNSPEIIVNNFAEYGFSELTPTPMQPQPYISTLATNTDSPWNFIILNDEPSNLQLGQPISIDINLYTTDGVSGAICVYSGTIEMNVPDTLSTEVSSGIYYNTTTISLTQL
jgi:hypothetical protein